jgi:hypothetical protein
MPEQGERCIAMWNKTLNIASFFKGFPVQKVAICGSALLIGSAQIALQGLLV